MTYVWEEFRGYLKLGDKSARLPAQAVGVTISSGERNNTLMSLAGTMRRRGMEAAAIYAALKVENAAKCKPSLGDEELRQIVDSISKKPPTSRKQPMNDIGLGRRFAAMYEYTMKHVAEWGCWMWWDRRRWSRDLGPVVWQRAKDAAEQLIFEGLASKAADDGKLLEWAVKCQQRKRIDDMIKMAQSELSMVLTVDAIDAHPNLLNLDNGTLDLETLTVCEHDPSHLLTKLAGVQFDAEAVCPRWMKFIERILPDPAVRAFVQRAVGYSLTADVSEHCLFLLHGDGDNGKSTFLETIQALLGSYAAPTEFRTLTKRRDDDSSIRNDLAALFGLRMVVAVESNQAVRLDEALIKQLTGGEKIKARFLRQEFFDFYPQFKLWLATNHKPKIEGTDLGIWRRIRLIPFNQTITAEEKDRKMKDKLLAELPGILLWAIEGCRQWKAEGLQEPPAVQQATKAYRKESDVFGPFFEARVVTDPSDHITAAELKAAIERWAHDHDMTPPDAATITSRMNALGHIADTFYVKRIKASKHAYAGLRLIG